MEVISFRGEYFFLSNFYPRPLFLDGRIYPTAEHAFQAGKGDDPEWKRRIMQAITPGEAERLGLAMDAKDGWWEGIRECHMFRVLSAKFEVPYLAKLLVDTGDVYLRNGHEWDRYWGCALDGNIRIGQNRLGHILMFVREIVRNKRGLKQP